MSDNVYRYARLLKRGDIVMVEDRESVVRGVDVVLHLADGTDHVISVDEQVEVVPSELPSDLEERSIEVKDETVRSQQRAADLRNPVVP